MIINTEINKSKKTRTHFWFYSDYGLHNNKLFFVKLHPAALSKSQKPGLAPGKFDRIRQQGSAF